MEIVAEFDMSVLKAMTHAVAKKDIRFYLNNVRIQRDAKATRLLASDGSVIVIRKIGKGSAIPLDAQITDEQIRAFPPATDIISVQIGDDGYPRLTNGTTTVKLETDPNIIGTYPDWRRVAPDEAGEKPADGGAPPALDQTLIEKAIKAFGPELKQVKPAWRGDYVFIFYGKTTRDNAVIALKQTIHIDGWEDVFAVIGTMRERPAQWTKPGWCGAE